MDYNILGLRTPSIRAYCLLPLFVIILSNCQLTIASSSPISTNPEDYTQITFTTSTTTTTTAFRCEYNHLEAKWTHGNISSTFSFDQTGKDSAVPSCLANRMNSAWQECRALTTLGFFANIEWDNCVAWKIFGAYQVTDGSNGSIGDKTSLYGAKYDWAPFSQNIRQQVSIWSQYTGTSTIIVDTSSRLYIRQNSDGSCIPVSPPSAGIASCYAGTYYWYSSPISLLWENNVDIDRDLHLSKFPIDPSKENSWCVWKASKQAPLLVYDPTHSGKITSAFQLFGNWTFGGKRSAHNRQDNLAASRPVPWKNGFEALATLDSNGDGQISGDELLPLGLWFDENRDGISDPGEVKSVAEVDVTTVYYHPNRETELTKNIYADRGYERRIGDKKIIGAAVDWHSDTATTKAELINRHLAPSMTCNKNAPNEETKLTVIASLPVSTDSVEGRELSKAIKSELTNLSGIWAWSSDSEEQNIQGYFGITDTDDGSIKGRTYSSFKANSKNLSFSNILSANHLNGIKKKIKDGKIVIQFQVEPEFTSSINSFATFYPVEGKLIGHSIAKVSFGIQPLDLTYSWVAKRMR